MKHKPGHTQFHTVEHCRFGELSPFLKSDPTRFIKHGSNAACPVTVSLFKVGGMLMDHSGSQTSCDR